MIFVDSNIPMYLVGAEHPHKADARALLELSISGRERLVTDAEVFQEILHRYAAIGRREAIAPAFDALGGLVDEIFPIEMADVERAKAILLERNRVSSRDALHVAVMERRRVSEILSFDAGFDEIPTIRRRYR